VNDNVLAVMVKAPLPGSVKTRLVPPLTPEQAAKLYECLVRDTFSSLACLEGIDLYAAYLGPVEAVKAIVPEGVGLFAQTGNGLGERMRNILKRLLGQGYSRCAVLGSDLPDLPAGHVQEAFALLDGDVRLVLGPAADGGYYLVAADEAYGPVFTGIRYSTATVLDETMAKAEESDIRCALASQWHDIDTFEDLSLLRGNRRAPLSSAYIESLGILL